MRVTYTELGPAEFRSGIGAFIAVYEAAMSPPERMLAGRETILERHADDSGTVRGQRGAISDSRACPPARHGA